MRFMIQSSILSFVLFFILSCSSTKKDPWIEWRTEGSSGSVEKKAVQDSLRIRLEALPLPVRPEQARETKYFSTDKGFYLVTLQGESGTLYVQYDQMFQLRRVFLDKQSSSSNEFASFQAPDLLKYETLTRLVADASPWKYAGMRRVVRYGKTWEIMAGGEYRIPPELFAPGQKQKTGLDLNFVWNTEGQLLEFYAD